MKIQCPCGARYEFDATPESETASIALVCQSCGQDLSAAVNQRWQEETNPTAPESEPTLAPGAPPAKARGPIRVTVSSAHTSPAAAPTNPAPVGICLRHGVEAFEICRVCRKPICPKCMALFGYVCSPKCREDAEKAGIELPIYELQREVVHARETHKERRVVWMVAAVLALLAGVFGYYKFVASRPHAVFSAGFPATVLDGDVRVVPPSDILLLRGQSLARYDLKTKRPVWTVEVPTETAAQRLWCVQGTDVWVGMDARLVECNWKTGQPAKEIPLPGAVELFTADPSAIHLLTRGDLGRQFAVRVSLPEGELTQTPVTSPSPVRSTDSTTTLTIARARRPAPVAPGGGGGPPALQAARGLQLIANERGLDDDSEIGILPPVDASRTEVVGGTRGLAQFTVELLKVKTATVQAMKPPPERSAFDGPVNAAATVAVVNETLNEMQRNRTGGVEEEDVSRYRVKAKRLLDAEAKEWIGEVAGPPELFSLDTCDVVIAARTMVVLDKSGRKQWESSLAYPVPELPDDELVPVGDREPAGPCVERGGTLFVFDLGVLTAFTLADGGVRWRLPSVGIRNLRFDELGMLYVNTTDAEQDEAKFRQQINIDRRVRPLILKVDPASGKILWRARHFGWMAKATGGFVYSLEWAGGTDNAPLRWTGIPAHVRLYCLDPETGQKVWEHYQRREPLSLDFHRNTIAILFKQELQTLRFVSF